MKDKNVKNKGGRPKKTVSSFPSDWESQIHELGLVGGSKLEMQGCLGIDNETMTAMMKRDHMFSAAINKALVNSEIWWTKHGRTKLGDKTFNAVLWYMNMKNRFGWKDKTETEVKPSQEISIKFTKPVKKS